MTRVSKEQFEEWAGIGSGRFYTAGLIARRATTATGTSAIFGPGGADELDEPIAAALQPSFEVRDSAGAVIASGAVGGDARRVSPGTYSVEVRSEPLHAYSDVVVGNGAEVMFSPSDNG
jgi:hypothetical protein